MTRRSGARDIALVAIFCALVIVLVPVRIGVDGPTPVVLQNGALMLAGAVLGARRGLWVGLLFVLLALVGLPVLASGVRGLAILTSPTVGFVVSYPLIAGVAGLVVERSPRPVRLWASIAGCLLGGIVVSYALGIPGMAWRSGTLSLTQAAIYALQFVPGDLVKAVVAGVVAVAVHRAVPGLLPASPAGRATSR